MIKRKQGTNAAENFFGFFAVFCCTFNLKVLECIYKYVATESREYGSKQFMKAAYSLYSFFVPKTR